MPRPTSSSTVNADAHGRARRGVAGEVGDRGHDLGDARLVVGAEQRRAVARDDVVADARREVRQLGRVEHLARVAGQHDRAARVGVVDDRRHTRRRVRRATCPRARSGPTTGALSTVPGRVANTYPCSVSSTSSRPIARSSSTSSRDRSSCFAVLGYVVVLHGRLRVDHDVAEEPLEHLVRELRRERACVSRPVAPCGRLSQESPISAAARRSWRAPRRGRTRGSSRSASASVPSAG